MTDPRLNLGLRVERPSANSLSHDTAFRSHLLPFPAVVHGTGSYYGTTVRSWLRHCATRRKFAASVPDGAIEISGRTVAPRFTRPLTKMSTMTILRRTGGVRAAGAFG